MHAKALRLVAGTFIAGATLLSGVAGAPVSADVITSGCGVGANTCVLVGGSASGAFPKIEIVIPITIALPGCETAPAISDSDIRGGNTCVRVAGR